MFRRPNKAWPSLMSCNVRPRALAYALFNSFQEFYHGST
ncbi:hypothetical protein [Pseudomonas phage vB_Pae_SG_WM_Sew_P3]